MINSRNQALGTVRRLVRICTSVACLALGSTALAAPYWTSYSGTIQNSGISGVTNGENYTVSLIFDNGGTSTNNQTWGKAHLKCVVWRMNNDGAVLFAQDLTNPGSHWQAEGQLQTNGSGSMTSMFERVGTYNSPGTSGAGAGTSSNMSPTPFETYWGVPKTGLGSAIFIAGAVPGTYTDFFEDADGSAGIPVSTSEWTPLTAFEGGLDLGTALPGCADPGDSPTPVKNVTAVPTLDLPALALLGMAAAGLGARRLRRRQKQK